MSEKTVKILKIIGLGFTIGGTILSAIASDKGTKLELKKLAEEHFNKLAEK